MAMVFTPATTREDPEYDDSRPSRRRWQHGRPTCSGTPARSTRLDTPMPQLQFNLCLYLITVVILMCHLPFSFIHNFYFRRFLQAVRPNFEKMLGCEWIRKKMAGVLLDEVYEEAVQIADEELFAQPGLITVGIDGHKDGRGRSLETVTKAKLGVSTFAGCEYMRTERATGQRLAQTVKKHILATWWHYIAVVADNTGNNKTMFTELSKVTTLMHLFYLGCYIHVLDLLIEDIAKIGAFVDIGKDAHFVISFIKSHSIIYEEFLEAKGKLTIRSDLHLYPATRFAYLYLMLQSVFKCIGAVRAVIDSPVYKLCKEEARKRGGPEGHKALEKFNTFEAIVETRSFKPKLEIGANVLKPLSCALHYLEGDSVPLSHVYPVFQGIYDFVQSLADELSVQDLIDSSDCEKMVELVNERWLGAGRKVGLKADVHLLSFTLDPYAQAAVSTPNEPTTTLLNSETLSAARSALRHHVREAEQRAVVSQQLQLWLAARPALPPSDGVGGSNLAPVAQGRNAYSSLYLASMEIIWDLAEAREGKIAKEQIKRPVQDEEDLGYSLSETIERLKLARKPTTFWLSMKAEQPAGAKPEELEAHKFFCLTALNVSSIVGHTCGVRACRQGLQACDDGASQVHAPRACQ